LADRPGSLAVEGASGLLEGSPRSRGWPEGRPWSGGVAGGFGLHQRGSLATQGRPGKLELASAAAARTLTLVTPTGAASTSRCWPGASAPEARRSRASLEKRRLAGNGTAWEVPAFARCARASVWLQKSAGDVRSRQDPLVAAGGSHGDLARGSKPEAKRRRDVDPGGNTWLDRTARGGSQVGGRRPVSWKPPSFTRWWQKRHWLAGRTGRNVGSAGWRRGRQRLARWISTGCEQHPPRPASSDRSGISAVKLEVPSASRRASRSPRGARVLVFDNVRCTSWLEASWVGGCRRSSERVPALTSLDGDRGALDGASRG
jgi:hypothetical protein